uniref:Uncharacterized protein n=1 Tax=Rangifer tarandus platyrhynchus TaxID=3082113 RepID=A0ACB0EIG3_RANTA|nr:unnamed protein product [Rangifer tarandus platyrhynchus]
MPGLGPIPQLRFPLSLVLCGTCTISSNHPRGLRELGLQAVCAPRSTPDCPNYVLRPTGCRLGFGLTPEGGEVLSPPHTRPAHRSCVPGPEWTEARGEGADSTPAAGSGDRMSHEAWPVTAMSRGEVGGLGDAA